MDQSVRTASQYYVKMVQTKSNCEGEELYGSFWPGFCYNPVRSIFVSSSVRFLLHKFGEHVSALYQRDEYVCQLSQTFWSLVIRLLV